MAAQDTSSSQSYLSKLSPWGRSSSNPPNKNKGASSSGAAGTGTGGSDSEAKMTPLRQQKGADHVVSHRHRLSLSQYPKDCPQLRPQWFHAVDVPKRTPHPAGEKKSDKPPAAPKKYAGFSTSDSKAIEAAFQRLIEEEDSQQKGQLERQRGEYAKLKPDNRPQADHKSNPNLEEGEKTRHKVPVSEDYLFDVDIEKRELAPAYWLGPVYDVRRGTWFYQDGSVQRPCDENLAAQLEEGYLKVKAWRISSTPPPATKPRSASQPRARPVSWTPGSESGPSSPTPASPKDVTTELKQVKEEPAPTEAPGDQSQNTYRLFGAHMNSVVTYQDASTAWLLTDDFMSRMNYSMYQRFAGGGHFAGMKMTRGYINPDEKVDSQGEKSDGKAEKPVDTKAVDSKRKDGTETQAGQDTTNPERPPAASEKRRQNLQRQMSSFLENTSGESRAKHAEELRKQHEEEMEEDYQEVDGDDQGREIEHLILVTHGIGQRLGLRLESVNFVHDVNTLRKTLKAVYAESPDLRALNAELENDDHINSRIQVIPICWRHLLDFPKQSVQHSRREHDVTDMDIHEHDYPSLEDITVDGVPAVRNLITDLALDILIYDSPIYKEHISSLVLQECNRTYHLFKERNPGFNGKVSFIGHSLGSTIMFDILCKQGPTKPAEHRGHKKAKKLDFEVEDFYALGSPIGLFQMLNGRTIAGSTSRASKTSNSQSTDDDPSLGPAPSKTSLSVEEDYIGEENPVSRPRCAQIYNIFHPTDPISYRMEPLISPAMAVLKPQPLPYTKRGIFGAPVGQGLTGIGARVSQSVSSMWSSMASSLLTRGLGYGDEPARVPSNSALAASKSSGPLSSISSSPAAGTNISSDVAAGSPPAPHPSELVDMTHDKLDRVAEDTIAADRQGQHPPTLIDNELETLYGDFQKRRKSMQTGEATEQQPTSGEAAKPASTSASLTVPNSQEMAEAEERGKKLRREEEKVRRLNSNGRVDYAIQEGAFDINLIAAIASHLSYWSDEDVSHFIISQLLSRHRSVRQRAQSTSRGRKIGASRGP